MLKQQIDQDLKAALLAGERLKVTVLRGLKSTITYAELDQNAREKGLDDEVILALLAKEAKKRQESADLYLQGGASERATKELEEKVIIEHYLPAQLSQSEVKKLVGKAVTDFNPTGLKDMGRIIAAVRQQTAGRADGALIAKLAKNALSERVSKG